MVIIQYLQTICPFEMGTPKPKYRRFRTQLVREMSKSFNSASYWLRVWNNITMCCETNNIKFINLTSCGIMNIAEGIAYEVVGGK